MENKLQFRKLVIGCAAGLISSLMPVTIFVLTKLTDSIIVSIITSLQFWGFLAAEIIVLVKLKKEIEISSSPTPVKSSKLWLAVLAVFAVSFILCLLITILNKGFETTFGMIFLSVCLFTFQMIFITKSKMFNIIVGERKDCEK